MTGLRLTEAHKPLILQLTYTTQIFRIAMDALPERNLERCYTISTVVVLVADIAIANLVWIAKVPIFPMPSTPNVHICCSVPLHTITHVNDFTHINLLYGSVSPANTAWINGLNSMNIATAPTATIVSVNNALNMDHLLSEV
jgi:hypothetical protein